jgi:hypothetical protein
MLLSRDGPRTPVRQTDLALQDRQMRSPDQVLTKRDPHIRHWRWLDAPGTPGSRAGLLFCHTHWSTAGFGPAKPVEAMAEGKVTANGDAEIARLKIDRPFPRVEPRLQFFSEIDSTMGKRRREIKYDCVSRIRCNDGSGILAVMGLVNSLDERPDCGFIFRRLIFQSCGCHCLVSFSWRWVKSLSKYRDG